MRTNLKAVEPETDELEVAQGAYDAAAERKSQAEKALADSRTRLAVLEAKVKTSPRDVLDVGPA